MISKSQYALNNIYNLFLTKLVLWYGLYNRYKADKEQGFHPIKNYEKMITLQVTLQTLLPSIENFSSSKGSIIRLGSFSDISLRC